MSLNLRVALGDLTHARRLILHTFPGPPKPAICHQLHTVIRTLRGLIASLEGGHRRPGPK